MELNKKWSLINSVCCSAVKFEREKYFPAKSSSKVVREETMRDSNDFHCSVVKPAPRGYALMFLPTRILVDLMNFASKGENYMGLMSVSLSLTSFCP